MIFTDSSSHGSPKKGVPEDNVMVAHVLDSYPAGHNPNEIEYRVEQHTYIIPESNRDVRKSPQPPPYIQDPYTYIHNIYHHPNEKHVPAHLPQPQHSLQHPLFQNQQKQHNSKNLPQKNFTPLPREHAVTSQQSSKKSTAALSLKNHSLSRPPRYPTDKREPSGSKN